MHWVPRGDDGTAIVEAVRDAFGPSQGWFGWGALWAVSTRAVTGILENDFGLGRKGVTSQAYWRVGRSAGWGRRRRHWGRSWTWRERARKVARTYARGM